MNLNVENALPLVSLNASPTTAIGPLMMAMICGVAYHSQLGLLEFVCEASFHKHDRLGTAQCKTTPSDTEYEEFFADREREEIERFIELKLFDEFKKSVLGEKSILTPLLIEVNVEVYDELH